ncbi:MAG: hypothetical protein COA78_12315 [Blastopirellula sp.]|nr:MAG: hypothetical protein COA78_12315 [Blastopirellula sp.]
MPIDFRCAVCKNQIRVPDDSGGKKTKCPKCNAIQRIPDGSAPSQPSSSPPLPSAGGGFGAGSSNAGQSADIPGSVSASQGSSSSGLGDDFWSQSGGSTAPDSDNPFAADPGNPYASPQQATSPYAPQASRSKEDCRIRLMPPAIILMVICGLSTAMTIFEMIRSTILMVNDNPAGLFFLILYGFLFLVHLMTLFGLYNAITMKNKAMAWFGFIMNMIPCGNMCCLICLPFAIWGMVILADAEVVSRNFDS